MSHFAVLVKISAAEIGDDKEDIDYDLLQGILEEKLAPYNEQDEQYYEFVDETDNWLKQYKSNEKFGHNADGTINENMQRSYPDDIGKTRKERYPTFEKYVEDGEGGVESESEPGRYGHKNNPNSHWDWWVIGGRWEGFLPIKTKRLGIKRESDFARVKELDLEYLDNCSIEGASSFFNKVVDYLDDKKSNDNLFLDVELRNMGITTDKSTKDLVKRGKAAFIKQYKSYFNWGTYAALDDNGWHEEGAMGWFGCDDSTPERRQEWHANFFNKFIGDANPNDVVVVVDCHI